MPLQFCLENNPNPMYEGRGGKNTAAYISNFLLSHLRDFFLCTPALLLFNAFLSSLVFPWKAVFLSPFYEVIIFSYGFLQMFLARTSTSLTKKKSI